MNLVLEGDVRFSKENLVVHAALMSVTGEQLWSEPPFERAIGSEGDIAAVVDDLARAIVNRLRLKLGPTRMNYPIDDWTTLRKYLDARDLREGRGNRSLEAVELYKAVIAAYPNHARAMAELAIIYGDLGAQFPTAPDNPSLPPDTAKTSLRELAGRALELDPFWLKHTRHRASATRWTSTGKRRKRHLRKPSNSNRPARPCAAIMC